MKINKNKVFLSSLMGVAVVSSALSLNTETASALGFGPVKLIPTQISDDGKTVLKYKFNPAFDSEQSEWYDGREMYREVYYPENGNLEGGFVWYSIVPQDKKPTTYQTYLGKMYENNQKVRGKGGDYLVSGAGLNLKYGSSNPWTGRYLGKDTGTKKIQYGTYKGKKYEWRFIGYNAFGSVVGNPYFPNDSSTSTMEKIKSKAEYGQYWSGRNWTKAGWNLPQSIATFGSADDLNKRTQKIKWIEDYFFKDYPAFKKQGSAEYWADYLRPLTDPSKETGVWLGWHLDSGIQWYNTMITTPPKQPNLRLVSYKIYDSNNKLVAEQTRNGTAYGSPKPTYKRPNPYVHKGETYKIVVSVKNMPHAPKNIKGTQMTLNHMYNFDDKIGDTSGYSTPVYTDVANSPYQNSLASGKVATFTYNYTVPTDKKPKDHVEFTAKIPEKFYNMNLNTITSDDDASIVMEVAPENVGVKFLGYYDDERNPAEAVTPNYTMWAKYKVTKTEGKTPVKINSDLIDLQVRMSDETTTTTNKLYEMDSAFTKNGKPITDGVLRNKGDYAVFWAGIKPKVTKVCTRASIPSKWANNGLNGNPADDVAQPACLVNPDNIVVSNFVAKPETVYLGKTQSKKSVQYTVNFNLTNFNYDKKDKTIPLVYTIDGRVVKTESVPVQSLKTMKISRVLPALSLGEGEHIVQVEANPAPRKYVEVKLDANGKEVNPYTDNIGFDRVHLERNKDSFYCPAIHTSNYWNTTFTLSYWTGYTWSHSVYDSEGYYTGSHTHYDKNWRYEYPTVSFYERHKVDKVLFRSKSTTDKQGGWVDLLSTKGKIKAGYGFELKVVTSYRTNTYNDTPKPYDNGFWSGRHVSPGYSWVDSTARLKITMPMVDDMGKPIALELDGSQSGSWYNNTTTYELEPRTVINDPERKVYINENTKDGNYNVRIETEPFYGSPDKPYTSRELCDIKNVTIEVKGSYLDDLKTHIVQ